MPKKQEIKQSEAKILVYLSVVHASRKHISAIAHKLDMDYSYAMRIIQAMLAKNWIYKVQKRRYVYCLLTNEAPLEKARNALVSDDLQTDLIRSNYTQEELVEHVVKDEVENGDNETKSPLFDGSNDQTV